MRTNQIVQRLQQLAAWYDPATKQQPIFPYGVHEYCREAAATIQRLEGTVALHEFALQKKEAQCYELTGPQLAHLSRERIAEIAGQYVLPAQLLSFVHHIERELNGLREKQQ